MFTGLVEEIGVIERLEITEAGAAIAVACRTALQGADAGDSIAVDGVCLTVTGLSATSFSAFASAETLRVTSLGDKRAGDAVNLERALTMGAKMGGHMVQGHIDGFAVVGSVTPEGDSTLWRFDMPPDLARYLVNKGSVTVDGISLTVVAPDATGFSAAIIPTTLQATTLQHRRPGDKVNIETDVIGKYVWKYLHG